MRTNHNTIPAALLLASLPCSLGAQTHAVSYSRQIAPILALHCTACHGLSNPSSGFRVTRFDTLMRGGRLGDEIIPGDPARSVLVQFLEGRRGPEQRMPQGAPPLSAAQIGLIRQWIAEGAHNDRVPSPCYELRLSRVPLSIGIPLEIACQIPRPAFLTLYLRDPQSHSDLYVEEASLNSPPDRANIGAPGKWIRWRIARERAWPPDATLTLRIQYAAAPLTGAVLTAHARRFTRRTSQLHPLTCVPD
jgi:mono/diheme cytochrome c family protein